MTGTGHKNCPGRFALVEAGINGTPNGMRPLIISQKQSSLLEDHPQQPESYRGPSFVIAGWLGRASRVEGVV